MRTIRWKHWIKDSSGRSEPAILDSLRRIEATFQKMILGIALLFIRWMPAFMRRSFRWLLRMLVATVRVMLHLLRLTAVMLGWLAIVLSPAMVRPNRFTALWATVALIGSIYGIRRTLGSPSSASVSTVSIPSAFKGFN